MLGCVVSCCTYKMEEKGLITHTVVFVLLKMDPLVELHAVLNQCGITALADRASVINSEGFTSIKDFTVLEGDTDVSEMAKRLVARPATGGHVNLGTIVIKRLQALIFWTKDCIKRDRQSHRRTLCRLP